jgi:riboflavin kinase, archaea type
VVKPADVEALKQLALLGALDGPVELASGEFAQLIDVSQQTASRRLIELAKEHLVQRELGVRKQRLRITEEGRAVLRAEYLLYQQLFESQATIAIQGSVSTGLGEGRYYLSRPGYKRQFEATLGWTPYPGTLNLELGGVEANKLRILRRSPVYSIDGFQAEGRSFGGVTCYPAEVQGLGCAAILPHRTHHATTLELIAPIGLRETLACKDGDPLKVTVSLRPVKPA